MNKISFMNDIIMVCGRFIRVSLGSPTLFPWDDMHDKRNRAIEHGRPRKMKKKGIMK